MNRYLIVALLTFAFSVAPCQAAKTNASSASINVYKAYMSLNGDCSNPIAFVDNGDSGQLLDMITSPTIGEGTVPPKTYKCLIIEMSDKLIFKPTTTTGNCDSGTTYTRYVCQSGYSTKNPITGASVACTGTSQTGEDRVWVYVSRWSNTASSNGPSFNAFTPPTSDGDTSNGIALTTDIDASKGGGAFVFSLDNKIDGAQNPCDLGAPTMSFRSL